MTTTLTDLGEQLAFLLDREVLRARGIDIHTELEVTVDRDGIHLRPASEPRENPILASARRVLHRHDETFRKLAR